MPTSNTKTDTQLLSDFVEKFGKRLNEEEKTLGDEIFMWLRENLQTPKTTRQLPEEIGDLKERVIEELYVNQNRLAGEWHLADLVDKAIQSAEAKGKQHVLTELRAMIDHNASDEGTTNYDGVADELISYLHNKRVL